MNTEKCPQGLHIPEECSSGSISDPYRSLKCQYSHEHWRKTGNTHYKSKNYTVAQEATEEAHMYTASVTQNIYKTITENIPTLR